jgi:hypothetical protein
MEELSIPAVAEALAIGAEPDRTVSFRAKKNPQE